MSRKVLLAAGVCTAGLAGLLLSGPVSAQGRSLGEYRSECQGREIVIWTTSGDLRIYRGQDRTGGAVATRREVVWLCDGERRTFLCQQNEAANFVDVEWRRSGEVTFYCMGR